jgi:hypothetical protein
MHRERLGRLRLVGILGNILVELVEFLLCRLGRDGAHDGSIAGARFVSRSDGMVSETYRLAS